MTKPKLTAHIHSFTKEDLARDYPQLHAVIEEIFAKDGINKHLHFWCNYCGKYYYPSGKMRKFQLATALEFIKRNGYHIEFVIKG